MSNCNLPPSELPHLIKTVHEALKSPDQTASSPIEPAWGGTKFLAPPQVARTLQMSKTRVLRWLKNGDLGGLQTSGRWYVSPRQLEAFLEARANVPRSRTRPPRASTRP